MDREQLIKEVDALIEYGEQEKLAFGFHAQASEVLRIYAGPKSSFYEAIKAVRIEPRSELQSWALTATVQILESFRVYLQTGFYQDIPPERRAQLEVVSDFLEMAQRLLDNKDVHPASAATLIGATLEEFLRTWVENQHLSLDGRKPGLEAYSQVLREANLITKQDGKDITSWAGVRNHAAHGEWDEVGDRARIRIMLEGVNLFMRRYSGE